MRRGNERQACAAFGIHKIHTERCSKELEKRSRLCIIFSVTCYRNGAQGGRVGDWVICSGAAPSSPSTGQGALPAPSSVQTSNLDLLGTLTTWTRQSSVASITAFISIGPHLIHFQKISLRGLGAEAMLRGKGF